MDRSYDRNSIGFTGGLVFTNRSIVLVQSLKYRPLGVDHYSVVVVVAMVVLICKIKLVTQACRKEQ